MSEIDRNQQARMKDEARRATLQQKQAFDRFRGDLQLGVTGLVDRFGNRCQSGDSVLWRVPATHDLAWTIQDIVPVLDPTKPVGVMRVKLVCEVPAEFLAGIPSVSMIRVGVQPPQAADAPAKTPEPGGPDSVEAAAHAEGEADAHGQLDRPVMEGEVPRDGSSDR
jgi:hypothetical protein